MESVDLQTDPVKLYIQDIYRAQRTAQNKFIFKFLNMVFKNISIHGIVTELYNNTGNTCNFELTDPTASVTVYFDSSKSRGSISQPAASKLGSQLANSDHQDDAVKLMYDRLLKTSRRPIKFAVGDYVSVIGDIFVDDVRSVRNVSAFECNRTSVEREIVWLEELQYLYEKFYLWEKGPKIDSNS